MFGSSRSSRFGTGGGPKRHAPTTRPKRSSPPPRTHGRTSRRPTSVDRVASERTPGRGRGRNSVHVPSPLHRRRREPNAPSIDYRSEPSHEDDVAPPTTTTTESPVNPAEKKPSPSSVADAVEPDWELAPLVASLRRIDAMGGILATGMDPRGPTDTKPRNDAPARTTETFDDGLERCVRSLLLDPRRLDVPRFESGTDGGRKRTCSPPPPPYSVVSLVVDAVYRRSGTVGKSERRFKPPPRHLRTPRSPPIEDEKDCDTVESSSTHDGAPRFRRPGGGNEGGTTLLDTPPRSSSPSTAERAIHVPYGTETPSGWSRGTNGSTTATESKDGHEHGDEASETGRSTGASSAESPYRRRRSPSPPCTPLFRSRVPSPPSVGGCTRTPNDDGESHTRPPVPCGEDEERWRSTPSSLDASGEDKEEEEEHYSDSSFASDDSEL